VRNIGWGIVIGAVVLGAAVWMLDGSREEARAPARTGARARGTRGGADPRIDDHGRRIRELQAQVEGLESELERLRDAVRASFAAATGPADTTEHATLLDRFLLSFADGGAGSEYFRLAVDAHAPRFVDRLAQLVADPAQPQQARIELIGVLGTERFRGNTQVLESLLGLLQADTPAEIAKPTLEALAQTADKTVIPALERYAGEVPWSNLPYEIYGTIAGLAGPERNPVLRRLLHGARDETSRTLVLNHIDRTDADGALLLFSDAWRLDAPVRVAAAERLGSFRSDEFKRFVDEKLAAETDPDVRASLERAKAQQGVVPPHDAMQAAGPPDADPAVDDPRAWASARADMGRQWIELAYKRPLRANRVRIFEVNSGGAVVEVQTVDASGRRRTAWRGTCPGGRPGVCELRIDAGGRAVARIRLILDTDRRPGWNEIDAVELVGSDGRAWASSAVASSSYED